MPLGFEFLTRAFAKRTLRGLYGGRAVLFGNKISKDGGNKSRRKWLPNVQNKRLYSEILDKLIPLRVTNYALRCIIKCGGLDEYVLTTKDKDMKSTVGMKLRERLLAKMAADKKALAAADRKVVSAVVKPADQGP